MNERKTILKKCRYHSYFENIKYYDFVDQNIFGSLLKQKLKGELEHYFFKIIEEGFELTVYDVYVVYKQNTEFAHNVMRKMVSYETKELDGGMVTICKEVIYLN